MTLGLSSGGANDVIVSDARLIGPCARGWLDFFRGKTSWNRECGQHSFFLSALKGDIRRPT
jgi:hypothetical protein